MKVYIIRHGQSASNKSGVRNGQTDVPLTEVGYKEAEAAGKKLQGIKFDKVFSSDLIRAVETGRTALPGCEPVKYKEIREIDVGKLAGHTSSECRLIFENYDENNKEHNYVPYGGENADMILSRVTSFMHMLETLQDCENIAVFTHHGAIYYMLRFIMNQPVNRNIFAIDNCSISIFEYKDNFWKILKLNQ